jgi:hypothetical protein
MLKISLFFSYIGESVWGARRGRSHGFGPSNEKRKKWGSGSKRALQRKFRAVFGIVRLRE